VPRVIQQRHFECIAVLDPRVRAEAFAVAEVKTHGVNDREGQLESVSEHGCVQDAAHRAGAQANEMGLVVRMAFREQRGGVSVRKFRRHGQHARRVDRSRSLFIDAPA